VDEAAAMSWLHVATGWAKAAAAWIASDTAGNVGSFIGGAATVVGVMYAAFEFRSWKTRRRADAAARALPVLEAFALSVKNWMNVLSLAASDTRHLGGHEARKLLADDFAYGRARVEIEERQKELARVGAEAEAVLKDEAVSLRVANGVYLMVFNVYRSAETEAIRAEQEAAIGRKPQMDLHGVVEGPLRELERRLDSALEDGRRVLGAIARHERVPRKAP
jgi:hypothetical protein